MALRYLRATGNWNGSVWAATSGGTAGSAATPTKEDTVFLGAGGAFTVTLTANAEAESVGHTSGTINFGGFTLTIGNSSRGYTGRFTSTGSTSRTVNMTNSRLELIAGTNTDLSACSYLSLTGSNLTFTATGSTIVIDCARYGTDWYDFNTFDTLSKTFNDVIINMGVNSTIGAKLNITGSPTFASLTIIAKNTATHEVWFNTTGGSGNGTSAASTVITTRFRAMGVSTSNRLYLYNSTNNTNIQFASGGESYGQYVNADASVDATGDTSKAYIGATSTGSGAGWIFSTPAVSKPGAFLQLLQ